MTTHTCTNCQTTRTPKWYAVKTRPLCKRCYNLEAAKRQREKYKGKHYAMWGE